MTAKDIIIDFLNYLFLLLVSIFMLFYVVFGNRMSAFAEFMNLLMAFSAFSFIFLIVLKIKRQQIKKYVKEDNLDEIASYASPTDLFIDRIITLSAFAAVIAIAFVGGNISITDFFQALIPSAIFFFWHLYLFKRGSGINKAVSLSKLDKIKDEVFIFFLPIVLLSIAILSREIDPLDAFQAIALFLILFYAHYKIFLKN